MPPFLTFDGLKGSPFGVGLCLYCPPITGNQTQKEAENEMETYAGHVD